MIIKTRFAPSPTGFLHIGNIRTALYSWLFAKKFQGSFILRIEDTDSNRSRSKYSTHIIDTLNWLGLKWDEGPYFQSKKIERYKDIINFLLEKNHAYRCYCSKNRIIKLREQQLLKKEKPRYDGFCKNLKIQKNSTHVIRFKNPQNGTVIFQDEVRGEIIFNNSELDDVVIQRSNGLPTYNLCVIVDDYDTKITHVIRGEDHINNTPRQINILNALKFTVPQYAHLSMITNEQKTNLSKRDCLTNILQYQKDGFFPESILNYLIRLGWSYKNQEIFSREEMIELFSLHSVKKSSSSFNLKKLLWINHYYLNKISINNLVILFNEYCIKNKIILYKNIDLKEIIILFKKRCSNIKELVKSCWYLYKNISNYDTNLLKKYVLIYKKEIFLSLIKKFLELNNWEQKNIVSFLKKYSLNNQLTMKDISMLLRVILTNSINSPNITSIIILLGRKKVLHRINFIINAYIKKV
ncbi:glutamate--tRNA ligase [Buchnera aphidicola (Kurisakia onigurumii)]|uniref:glutamate--tRNA ligase n=1 Tax=Buchnera aphidicola TaxID=9 RepID=UPI0031B6C5E4